MSGVQPALKSAPSKPRYAQDEIIQFMPLPADENYCIPSTTKDYFEQYVRCQLSFEDPVMEKCRETNDSLFEVYDYLTLKLEAMFNGKSESFPQLFTKEWDSHYSTINPDNDSKDRRRVYDYNDDDDDQFLVRTPDERGTYKKDKKSEVEEKRARKRAQRTEKAEKPKKFKAGRD